MNGLRCLECALDGGGELIANTVESVKIRVAMDSAAVDDVINPVRAS